MLTAREQDVLSFLEAFLREHGGMAPSFAQIAAGCGFASKSRIASYLDSLERAGRIRRLRDRVRAIEIVTQPPRVAYFVFDDATKTFELFSPRRVSGATSDRS